jgi:hypothetical protein
MNDLACGYTPRQVAKILRISPDRVRAMVQRGELGALNLATHRCGKPRYVILPRHLDEFARLVEARPEAKPAPPRKRVVGIDYYPDS